MDLRMDRRKGLFAIIRAVLGHFYVTPVPTTEKRRLPGGNIREFYKEVEIITGTQAKPKTTPNSGDKSTDDGGTAPGPILQPERLAGESTPEYMVRTLKVQCPCNAVELRWAAWGRRKDIDIEVEPCRIAVGDWTRHANECARRRAGAISDPEYTDPPVSVKRSGQVRQHIDIAALETLHAEYEPWSRCQLHDQYIKDKEIDNTFLERKLRRWEWLDGMMDIIKNQPSSEGEHGWYTETYWTVHDQHSREYAWGLYTMQTCPGDLRAELVRERYVDIDMRRAAPSLALQLANSLGVKVPSIRDYVMKSDTWIGKVVAYYRDYGCEPGHAKNAFRNLLMGNSLKAWRNDHGIDEPEDGDMPWLVQYRVDARALMDRVDREDRDPTYKSIRETVTRIANVKGVKFNPWSTLSHVIGGMEKRFVNAAIAAIGNTPGNRGTGGRIFDGFNMERRDGDTEESLNQLVESVNAAAQDATDFGKFVTVIVKPMVGQAMSPLNRAPVEPPVAVDTVASGPLTKAPIVESAGVAPVAVDTVTADPLTKTPLVESVRVKPVACAPRRFRVPSFSVLAASKVATARSRQNQCTGCGRQLVSTFCVTCHDTEFKHETKAV
jgi:hypothetical protein